MAEVPSQEEVLAYFTSCSNWGRWGTDDELGTLNHITPEHRIRAAGLVREGLSVGCARPIPRQMESDFRQPPLHHMLMSGDAAPGRATEPNGLQAATEFFGLVFHGFSVTHVDSLGHVFRDGEMYNGHPADKVSTAQGATIQSVDTMRDGVVSRGVLLDIARLEGVPWLASDHAVLPEHLDAAEQAAGVQVGPGDILLCRFGSMARRNAEGPSGDVWDRRPGLHAACLPWLHEREIAMLGSDSAQDLFPSGYERVRLPIHEVGIVAMGLPLLDNCDLEGLADTCTRLGRWEFLMTIGALRITNGTGSPPSPSSDARPVVRQVRPGQLSPVGYAAASRTSISGPSSASKNPALTTCVNDRRTSAT